MAAAPAVPDRSQERAQEQVPEQAQEQARQRAQQRTQKQLEEARRGQQAALEEAARLRTEADARRRADEEAALRRSIAEEMRQKAEADEAARRQAAEDARRQAAAELAAQVAARQQAEADAKSRADAEAQARRKAEEADLKGAEAAEQALRLSQFDRQRLQVALTALGFPTGGSDGAFGARSREMIAAWQRKAGRAATGYLTAETQAALLREAAPAIARFDEEQRKQLAGQAPAAAGQQPAPARGPTPCEGTYTAQWCRAAYEGFPSSCWNVPTTISNGTISGGWTSRGSSERQSFEGRVEASGDVQFTYRGIGQQTHVDRRFTVIMTGSVAGNVLKAGGRAGQNGRDFTVTIQCR